MRFNIIQGNIFDCGADALVNPVNCVGVMGKGLALAFKARFPQMFGSYVHACRQGHLRIGSIHVHDFGPHHQNPRFVLNFPTKYHWRDRSEIQYIFLGLQSLSREIETLGIQDIALPALGCGLGGLDFSRVSAVIEQWAHQQPCQRILLFRP